MHHDPKDILNRRLETERPGRSSNWNKLAYVYIYICTRSYSSDSISRRGENDEWNTTRVSTVS